MKKNISTIIMLLVIVGLFAGLCVTAYNFHEYRESVRNPVITDGEDNTSIITIGDCTVVVSKAGEYSVNTPDTSFAHTTHTIRFEFEEPVTEPTEAPEADAG